MIRRIHIFRYHTRIALFSGFIFISSMLPGSPHIGSLYEDSDNTKSSSIEPQKLPASLEKLNASVNSLNDAEDINGLISLSDSLKRSLSIDPPDSVTLAEIYYYIGVCSLLAYKYDDALPWLNLSVDI